MVILGSETAAEMVGAILDEMLSAVRHGHTPTLSDVAYALSEAQGRGIADLGSVLAQTPGMLRRDIGVKPRTYGQRLYLEAIQNHDITLAVGPAGTGKTFLAMATAVSALLAKEVNRLVLTRPAVEAGENLGFLPGDIAEKVNPYLRPLYDALYSMVDAERAQRMFERQVIEVAPLAFMRGRTLSHSFIILDEAQNTTPEQMFMFLTRLGEGSRAVVTGDVTQIDLPKNTKSGLIESQRILRDIPDIAIVNLGKNDVVRHPLVQRIVDAYEADTPAKPIVPDKIIGAGGQP